MNHQQNKEESHGNPFFPLHVYSCLDNEGSLRVPYHWHDEIEFIYVEQGEININLNGQTHQAKAGELYFINSQDLHQLTASTESNSHHAIVFNPQMLKFELYDYCQIHYINPLIAQNLRFLFQINPPKHILDLLIHEYKEAINAYQKQEVGWSIMVKASLLKIIAILIKENLVSHSTEVMTTDYSKVNIAKKVMSYIHENYETKITIEELSEISMMSPQYFCKFFKSMFGKTVTKSL